MDNKNTSTPEPSNVRFFRTKMGDDLVAELEDTTDLFFMLKNPMLLITDIDMAEGKQNLILFPWIPQGVAKGNHVMLDKKEVLLVHEIEEDIEDYYYGICLTQFDYRSKPKVVGATTRKASEVLADKGKNVVSFPFGEKKDPEL